MANINNIQYDIAYKYARNKKKAYYICMYIFFNSILYVHIMKLGKEAI